LVGLVPLLARTRRKSRIESVVPGPRPRWESFDGEHWRLIWLFAVGKAKQQTSNIGLYCFYYVGASALEVEEEKGWISLGHFKTGAFYPRQFLCG
jgi:hypothetical protein